MSKLYSGSICVSEIPKDKLTTAKNGKLYINLDIWVNDTPDQYENIGSISVRQSKEEREAKSKKIYLGNFKPIEKKAESNDLPF